MGKTLLATLLIGAMSIQGCATTRYRGITLEGFPLEARFGNNCTKGKIQIGPFRGITILGEDSSDDNGNLNSITITVPRDYPVRTTSKKSYESDLPEEHPLSKYANWDVLQKLYDEIRSKKCIGK